MATWSLSEFLNLIELRGQTWCVVDMASSGGFSIPHSETILFYAALEGTAKISGTAVGSINLNPGDIAMVVSGEAHTLRSQRGNATEVLDFLHKGEYADAPPIITLGRGRIATRLLAGRLKVRWPGGQHPRAMPPVLRIRSNDSLIDVEALERLAEGSGGMAVLTQAAMLVFLVCFRDQPECGLLFSELSFQNPIARARQFIERHPFTDWTVDKLAKKVAMGRSSFAARFAAEIGRTPYTIVTEERMKHAAKFLEQGNLKVAEIAARIGYRSEAAFSRRFTTYYGVSPSKIRKKWQEARRALPSPAKEYPTFQ